MTSEKTSSTGTEPAVDESTEAKTVAISTPEPALASSPVSSSASVRTSGDVSGSTSVSASGNVSGTSTGSVSGAPTGNVSGTSTGSVSGNLTVSLSGNISGSIDTSGMSREEAIKARRIAHGLSPEASGSIAKKGGLEAPEKKVEDRKKKVKREHRAKVAKRAVIIALVVIVLVVAVGFWLIRWGLHDDAADFQGTWKVQGTDTTISVTDRKIVLNNEVSYDYVLDPSSKTLKFTFGGLSGEGRYRFSLDHLQLAIDDGEHDWLSTFASDVPWTAEALVRMLTGEIAKSPAISEGDTVLVKVS